MAAAHADSGFRPAADEGNAVAKKERKMVRVWCDGCYDMMHFGHANSLRQAKLMGDYLIVGVHTDEEIRKNKGPPVMTEQERYEMVRACKWVDEVVEAAPYVTLIETLDAHGCDFSVHGDDITTTADGTDTYQIVKDAGRYRECKRTAGVSTTDLVGRMLLLNRRPKEVAEPIMQMEGEGLKQLSSGHDKVSPYTRVSHFLPTTKKIMQFSDGKEPQPGDKVIYLAGGWDLCHIGHVRALRKAKEYGQFLIAGIHTDATIEAVTGVAPVMTLHERVLSVLALRYVDEVVIGAPYDVTHDMIDHFKIDTVLHGSASKIYTNPSGESPYKNVLTHPTCKFVQFESPSNIMTSDIIDRIIANRLEYQARNDKKNQKELDIIKQSMSKIREANAEEEKA